MAKIERRDLNLRRLGLEELVLSVAMSLEDQIVHDDPDHVVILCGNGRNGDYGLMLAHLLKYDTNIDVKLACENLIGHRYEKLLASDGITPVSSQRNIKEQIEKGGLRIIPFIVGYRLSG